VLFVSTFQHQIATMLAESTRKKSCASCRLAKTRCNMAAPKCSRCEMRRIECAYEMKRYASSVSNSNEYNQAAESTSHGTTVSNHRGPSMASSSSLAAEVLVEHLDAFQHDMASQDPRRVALDALPGQGLENGLQNELDLDWDFGLHSWDAGRSGIEDDQSATAFENLNTIIDRPTDMKDLGITNFPSRQSRIQFSYPMLLDKDSQSQPRSPSPPSMPGHSLPSGGRALVQSSPRILAILPDPNIPGLFLPRNFATSSTSFTAKYLMAVLSSFPKLMYFHVISIHTSQRIKAMTSFVITTKLVSRNRWPFVRVSSRCSLLRPAKVMHSYGEPSAQNNRGCIKRCVFYVFVIPRKTLKSGYQINSSSNIMTGNYYPRFKPPLFTSFYA